MGLPPEVAQVEVWVAAGGAVNTVQFAARLQRTNKFKS
jgi:hypothetical protein